MKKPSPLRFFVMMTLLVAASAVRAAEAAIVDLGDNTFSCTYEATTTFNRDADKMIGFAKEAVAEFCAARGREPRIVSVTVEKPWMTLGIPKATVVFKPLEPGDPALSDPEPAPVTRKGIKGKKEPAAAAPAVAVPPNDLYRTLLNLDDLRKKGILTEEEFQAEKKKVLARSK